MYNTCYNCGQYRVDKIIEPEGPYAVCPVCGYKHPISYFPLLIVTGASGTGKSTVCSRLAGKLPDAVILEGDIIWSEVFNQREKNYRDYFELILRICKNIAQSRKHVVVFGSGIGVPENISSCVEARYFSSFKYLCLTCRPEILRKRLESRPEWRRSSNEDFIQEQLRFNEWFVKYGQEADGDAFACVDTSSRSIEDVTSEVSAWIRRALGAWL